MEIDLGKGFDSLLGFVLINGDYYNFKPIAKIGNSALGILSDDEQKLLAEKLDFDPLTPPQLIYVSLFCYFDQSNRESLMQENFPEGSLVVISPEQILPPVKNGTPSLFHVRAMDMIQNGISRIHNYNVFHVISPSNADRNTVDSKILPGEQVYVESDGFYYGPYKVNEDRSVTLDLNSSKNRHCVEEFQSDELSFSIHSESITLPVIISKKPDNNTSSGQPRQDPQPDSGKEQFTQEIARLKSELGILKECERLEEERKLLDQKKAALEQSKGQFLELDAYFNGFIEAQHKKMLDIAFDGFLSSKLLKAAAQWEAEDNGQAFEALVEAVNQVGESEDFHTDPQKLIDYLCDRIRHERPQYDDNTIINIAICMTQGFLTVFSGEPGCGKTSICNLFANALGLNQFHGAIPEDINIPEELKASANRFLSVSVEKGWTSKRDFIGYYNPLSKTFDKSNRRVYDAIRQLDIEKRENKQKYPYVILLDEANLSPMEYYWADFMNICDNPGANSEINLGESYVYQIPETLHFLATINNDHTTETLSPRLVDRAWIITLPKFDPQGTSADSKEAPISYSDPKIITWQALANAFIPDTNTAALQAEMASSPKDMFPADIYQTIIEHLKAQHISISPRVDIAIKRYWAVAAKYFKEENTIEPKIIALDYAVAQKILPKILGNGEKYEKWLNAFQSLCKDSSLNKSAAIIGDIIEHGNQQMNYYQFFC